MDIQKQNWNRFYKKWTVAVRDGWLQKYRVLFEEHQGGTVLDLGCGSGSNLGFLCKRKLDVYACDYSEAAIKRVKKKFEAKAAVVDFCDGLPYPDSQFDIIISDLSLHYFRGDMTKAIIAEVSRVLKPNGVVLLRVNWMKDTNHGVGVGEEVEKHVFLNNGQSKRFFDRADIQMYFQGQFHLERIEEGKTYKYGLVKKVWEVMARNKKGEKGSTE